MCKCDECEHFIWDSDSAGDFQTCELGHLIHETDCKDFKVDEGFEPTLIREFDKRRAGLLPCPFCGAGAMRYTTMNGFYIECDNHHRMTSFDWRDTEKDWNRRV